MPPVGGTVRSGAGSDLTDNALRAFARGEEGRSIEIPLSNVERSINAETGRVELRALTTITAAVGGAALEHFGDEDAVGFEDF